MGTLSLHRRGRLAGLALAASALFAGQEREGVRLTLVVEGVRNSRGVVGALIFGSAQGWPENSGAAVAQESRPAQPGTDVLVFELPPGTYAAVVLHDENSDRKLERNRFGLPKEGWGMSNNPKAHLSAPSFERARFTLQGDTELRIRLNY